MHETPRRSRTRTTLAAALIAFLAGCSGEPSKPTAETPTEFRYEELTAGTGASPAATDRVKVHYRGTLMDGTEFDSSYKRNKTAVFPLTGVITCWTQGLQKMKVGGKSRLTCPPDIAYGPNGKPPVIPPNATLMFEVELLEIVK